MNNKVKQIIELNKKRESLQNQLNNLKSIKHSRDIKINDASGNVASVWVDNNLKTSSGKCFRDIMFEELKESFIKEINRLENEMNEIVNGSQLEIKIDYKDTGQMVAIQEHIYLIMKDFYKYKMSFIMDANLTRCLGKGHIMKKLAKENNIPIYTSKRQLCDLNNSKYVLLTDDLFISGRWNNVEKIFVDELKKETAKKLMDDGVIVVGFVY